MGEDWLGRWRAGRTGWHEPGGNAALRQYWPALPAGSRVLVPLCGKAPDLAWLAQQGLHVCGVELSPLAVEQFFDEHDLAYRTDQRGSLIRYAARGLPLELHCGDYFDYVDEPFDAVFDRGALIALPPERRPAYAAHTDSLMAARAVRLLITLEYDQQQAAGPPFAVMADEVLGYWPGLQRVAAWNDIANAPPKFRDAGLTTLQEVVWLSGSEAA